MEPGILVFQFVFVFLLCSGALEACYPLSSLDVTTPGSLEALSGSCLQIPCNFTMGFGKVQNPMESTFIVSKPVYGVWIITNPNFINYPDNVIFNSSLPNNTYPIHITRDLREKDCTTMFYNLTTNYSNRYYFRIENRPYMASTFCDPLQITVKDSPWSPSLNISGEQAETEVVTITCSAVTPCPHAPPNLTWDLHQGTVNITETNPDRTITTKSKLNITLTDSHDGQMIKCSAVYPVSGGFKMADSNITLSVTYGPKDTSVEVSPPGSLSAGQSVTLSCSSRANPPVHNFTWFTHSSQGPVSVSEGHTYHFNLTEDGHFYCVASNGIRNESSPVFHLQISEDEASDVSIIGVLNIVQLCGVVLLYSSLLIFECWFRAPYGTRANICKPSDGNSNLDLNVNINER